MAVLRSLGELKTIVDVGANRGQFALVTRNCFPLAQIISFEPLAEPSIVYREIFRNDARCTLHEVAIGPEAGHCVLHRSARDDSSSLLPITATQTDIFPGTSEVTLENVQIARLEEFLSMEEIELPALLKLDVQGFEVRALSGCEDLLDCFGWVYVECSFMELYAGQALADEVIAWVQRHHFSLRGVYNVVYDRMGRAVQADFLFRRLGRANR